MALIINKVFTLILIKYSDFADFFFLELASEFPKHTRINDHIIKLIDKQQLFYKPIYSLEPVELETLKTFIKINLANSFIKFSKFLAEALISIDKKLGISLWLYIN